MTEATTASETQTESSETQASEMGAESTEQQTNLRDYRSRIMSGGEFAWEENQKHQSAAGTAVGKLKKAEAAIRAAELVGNGDIEVGGRSLADVAGVYTKIASHPKMAEMVSHFLQTGEIPNMGSNGEDEYEDPSERALRDLQSGLERVNVRMAKSEMMNQIEQFFEQDAIGQQLDKNERKGVLEALMRNVEQWSKTPAGRQQLETINANTISLIALAHLKDTGTLLQVSQRMARQKASERDDASTEGPSGISTTGAGLSDHYNAKPGTKDFTLEVVRDAIRKFS